MDPASAEVAPNRPDKQTTTSALTPLVIRTVADVLALSASPAQLKRLPQNGLVIEMRGLDEQAQQLFRSQIRRYVRACGCSAAGATFLLGSASSVGYAARLALNHAWIEFSLTIAGGMVLTPGLAVAAKFLALRHARKRFHRSCARLIQSLSGGLVVRDSGGMQDGM